MTPKKTPISNKTEVTIKRLNLNELRTDGGIRCRFETPKYLLNITHYAEAMKKGDKFPAIRAWYDETEKCYWLSDGYLRLEATRKAGFKTIDVEVRVGDKNQAILDAVGANTTHGWQRSNAEKREAVLRLLNNNEWKQSSSYKIAKFCHVSHTFVDNLKKELKLSSNGCWMKEVVAERNGTTYKMKPARRRGKNLTPKAIDLLKDTTFADDENGLGKLARRPEAVQEVAAQLIADGRTRSAEKAILEAEKEIREGQSKNVKNVPLDPKNKGKYRTIMIDPPWDLGDGGRFSPSPHYKVMSFAEIETLEIDDYAAKDCHLYLWVVKGVLPEAFGLVDKWGFELKSIITWVKVDSSGKPMFGSGSYFRNCTEFILFGVRGSLRALQHDLPNFFEAERRKHSEKPDAAYELAEKMSPTPRLEMYARKTRPGWTPHGDQVDLLAA